MKAIVYATVILLTLLTLPVKAEIFMKFNPDSIPSKFAPLKEYINKPVQYLDLWNKIKQEVDTLKEEKTENLFFLYLTRYNFHYKNNDSDSLRKYLPVFQNLCLKLNSEYYFYRSWDLLCEVLLFTNDIKEEATEHQKMYNDALGKKSEIGMAFSTSRIGMGYATQKEYSKAKPYFQQAISLFEKIRRWNEYITYTSNYIIILKHIQQKKEALQVFMHLDSLANSFIESGDIVPNAPRIMMIKDMACEVYEEPADTTKLKKYIKEIEQIYQKVPDLSRIYLYNSKSKYAGLRNNLWEQITYQDSAAQYYFKHNNMVNLPHIYKSIARSLYKLKKYEDAYLMLCKHISLNDSIYKEDFQRQLNEMSTRYNLNKLELEAEKANMKARNIQYYYACALIIILLITLIISIKYYSHKLKSNKQLKEQALALISANEKVQKAQQMKTAFIQNMNHEVRTPLNAIVGLSECIADIPMDPEDIKEISTTIKKNSDKLLKIINDMISIANIDSSEDTLTYEDLSIDALCTDLTQEMHKYAQPGVNLHYTPMNTDYIFSSNRDTVHQILMNLIHNALKFTINGEVELSYRIDNDGKSFYFYVRDTGPGISSDLKEKVFERFFKIDYFMPGTGLGLALCRVLAERLDAKVYLDDSYQKGCLFVLSHPLKKTYSIDTIS